MIVSSSKFLQGAKPKLVSPASGTTQIENQSNSPGFLSRVSQDLSKRGQNISESFARSEQGLFEKGQSPLETGFQVVGQAAGAVGDVIGEGLASIPAVQKGLESFAKTSTGKAIGNTYAKYEEWAKLHPQAAANLESTINIASLFPGEKVATTVGKETLKLGEEALATTAKSVKQISEKIPQLSEKVAQVLATEADPKVLTILKETPVETFDKYVSLAEKAATDPRAQTGFEYVGERMADATKQLKGMMSDIGKKKSDFLHPLRSGLDPFDSQSLVDNLVQLKNRSPQSAKEYIQGIIENAKKIKTKGAADKFIDTVQDKIFTDSGNGVIAQGSALNKQLRGVLKSFNTELKASLPAGYSTLNTQYSNLTRVIKTLNKAMGEVVEGVPTQGASLVKQFFSPSGTKAKELFAFIKEKTGIDLAQEATLAKFTGEVFDDPRVRSLLQGIPRTKTGLVEKAVDFTAEKTGIGQKTRDVIRKGTLQRARSATIDKTLEGRIFKKVKDISVDNTPGGLSVKNISGVNPKKIDIISRNLLSDDRKILTSFVDAIRSGKKPSVEVESWARYFMEGIGANPEQPNGAIRKIFEEILNRESQHNFKVKRGLISK